MSTKNALLRAQIYRFLADAFLYPADNWIEDIPLLHPILCKLNLPELASSLEAVMIAPAPDLQALQYLHRQTFGLSGSLCYETEYGLPHEFRQSQELADIAGFYRAFGFNLGGQVRERADFIATELEFMAALCLKEAWAIQQDQTDLTEITVEAQKSFLQDHLGQWIEGFTASLNRLAQLQPPQAENPYLPLSNFTFLFVRADMRALDVSVTSPPLNQLTHTPLAGDLSCSTCPLDTQGAWLESTSLPGGKS
ncbi:MAG: TorD/DmsD family molecular chaperone [Chloroflexota bacterium]